MKNTGFTTIEFLTVIAIILTLIGIGIPAYNSWRNRGKIGKAKATIAQIEMALEMYKSDNGWYPNDNDNLNNTTGSKISSLLSPYMKFKSEDLDGNNLVLDPWKRAYIVYVDDGDPDTAPPSDFRHNLNACYIYSQGPDASNNNSNTADDIDNYKR